ncbi:MAG: D-alanine--D-alanine ligase A, partial [Chloroflexi bacterium]|nr:D-alanine--D-alanine ligase A [Chloroflexota bacterium]
MADSARRRLRVGVLFGGRSGEHEVSLHSARAVMAALREAGHEVVPIGISKMGQWLVGGDPLHALSAGTLAGEQPVTMLPEPGRTGLVPLEQREDALEPLRTDAPVGSLDVLFPVLHGTYGEDGTVQGLFELAAVPYAGSGVLGSALGMDKVVQKTLWRGLGLPVTDFLSVSRRELRASAEAVVARV